MSGSAAAGGYYAAAELHRHDCDRGDGREELMGRQIGLSSVLWRESGLRVRGMKRCCPRRRQDWCGRPPSSA